MVSRCFLIVVESRLRPNPNDRAFIVMIKMINNFIGVVL